LPLQGPLEEKSSKKERMIGKEKKGNIVLADRNFSFGNRSFIT
jgi:hypothetical protein